MKGLFTVIDLPLLTRPSQPLVVALWQPVAWALAGVAAVAASVSTIAGWAYNSHGENALKNARKADHPGLKSLRKLSST